MFLQQKAAQVEQVHAANWEAQKSQVENDIERMKDGLSPLPQPDGGTSLDIAKGMAGDKRAKEFQKLQHGWDLAIYSNNLKAPLTGMSYLDQMKFLNDPENKPRGDNYAEMKQEHNEALKVADEIQRLRTTDPSKSVSGFTVSKIRGGENNIPAAPEVQAAIAEANKKKMVQQLDGSSVPVDAYTDQQKWGLIMQGRRAAQTKAGIAPGDQVITTLPEAESLFGMQKGEVAHTEDPKENALTGPNMDHSLFAEKMTQAAERAKEWFGPHALEAMESATRLMVHDSVRKKAASDAMAELAIHGTLTPATVDAVINSGKIDPLASFIGRNSMTARQDIGSITATAGPENQPLREVPTKDSIQALQANPETWKDFAQRFGAEATVRALTGGNLTTPGLQESKPGFWNYPLGFGKRLNEASPEDVEKFSNSRTARVEPGATEGPMLGVPAELPRHLKPTTPPITSGLNTMETR